MGDGGNATPYELQLAEKEKTGWFHYLKLCLVVVKISLISSMMMTGVVKRRLKTGKFDAVTALFLSYITVLIGLLAFEFGKQYIFAFFILFAAANFLNFTAFMVMLRHLRTPERAEMKKHTNAYLIVMILLYVAICVFCCFRMFGPFCLSHSLYPPVMSMLAAMYVINAIFHHVMHWNHYFLKWEEHPEVKLIEGNEEANDCEPLSIIKPLFNEQMKNFIIYQTIVACLEILIQFGAYLVAHDY